MTPDEYEIRLLVSETERREGQTIPPDERESLVNYILVTHLTKGWPWTTTMIDRLSAALQQETPPTSFVAAVAGSEKQ